MRQKNGAPLPPLPRSVEVADRAAGVVVVVLAVAVSLVVARFVAMVRTGFEGDSDRRSDGGGSSWEILPRQGSVTRKLGGVS